MTSVATAPSTRRSTLGFLAGSAVGTLGGLIGLGGAEFRLPLLVGMFGLATLPAIILNKAMSLVVVAAALIFRTGTISMAELAPHLPVTANLLGGSLVGAWWAAGHAIKMSRRTLDRIVMAMLLGLAVLMMGEAWFGIHEAAAPLFSHPAAQISAGLAAGFGIGIVAALLGVAGGELLIPTIVLLYGLDIKTAGSISLLVSLPTMIVGFARYRDSTAFSILHQERSLAGWMAAGSVLGAAIGGLLLGLFPTRHLAALLGVILLISAIKTFKHSR